jgi:hypothetical protein
MIRKYVDLLLSQVRRLSKDGPVAVSDWYNFTTFDVIGDLAFGEPFGCMEGATYDGWIKGIFAAGRIGTILHALAFFPYLKKLLFAVVPKSVTEARDLHTKNTKAKMARRMANTDGRPDLLEGLIRKQDELVHP